MLVWKALDLSISFEWDPCWVEYLGCRFFPFSTLNISCHSLQACRVSAERSADKRIGFPWYVNCRFSFAAFNILSLCLVFVKFISMCPGMFLLGFVLYGTLCIACIDYLFPFGKISMLGKFSTIISSKFSHTLCFSLLLLGPLLFECLCVWYCPRGLWDYPHFFSLFLLYSAPQKLFPRFYLPAHGFILLLQIFCYWFLLEYF